MVKVLSIDGGGIKGIIPACLLSEIEYRTGKRISDMFSLIAGTSTGGILACGLVVPDKDRKPKYKASDLIKLYESEGRNIFSRSIYNKLWSLGNLIDEKYPSGFIDTTLFNYFRTANLSDSLVDIIITSYDIHSNSPYFFKSRKARLDPALDFPLKEVARSTSAAPTFFEPNKILNHSFIDGGVFANNPAMCAYAESRKHFTDDDILIVSIGCGENMCALDHNKAKGFGLIKWAVPLTGIVMDGVSDTVNYQLKELLPSDRYFRFQADLKDASCTMDDTTIGNIYKLKLSASRMIRERSRDIDYLCEMLMKED